MMNKTAGFLLFSLVVEKVREIGNVLKHKKGLNTEIQHKTYSSLSIYYSGFRKHTNFTISTLAPDFDTDKLLGWVQETRMSEENEKLCVLAPIALNT